MKKNEMIEKGLVLLAFGLGAAVPSLVHAAPADSSAAKGLPVRVSRDFFENRMEAELRVKVLNGDSAENRIQSDSQWKEYPTELPAPKAGAKVLADYRDFKGCADVERADGVRLCFNVMPDVSSVGLNKREMALEGLESVVPSQCNDAVRKIAFSGATRDAAGFTVAYEINEPECQAQVQLSIRNL